MILQIAPNAMIYNAREMAYLDVMLDTYYNKLISNPQLILVDVPGIVEVWGLQVLSGVDR